MGRIRSLPLTQCPQLAMYRTMYDSSLLATSNSEESQDSQERDADVGISSIAVKQGMFSRVGAGQAT